MANNLGNVVSKFTTRLDKILETATCTADLNMNGDLLGELRGNGFDYQSVCHCESPRVLRRLDSLSPMLPA